MYMYVYVCGNHGINKYVASSGMLSYLWSLYMYIPVCTHVNSPVMYINTVMYVYMYIVHTCTGVPILCMYVLIHVHFGTIICTCTHVYTCFSGLLYYVRKSTENITNHLIDISSVSLIVYTLITFLLHHWTI